MKRQRKEKRQSPYPVKRLNYFWQAGSWFRCPLILDLEIDRVMSILYDFLRLQNIALSCCNSKRISKPVDPICKNL